MPLPTPVPGGGSGSSANAGVSVSGVEHTSKILTTAAGAQGAAAAQLFATPHMDRRKVSVTNCEASGGTNLYVAFDSSVSATRFYAILVPLDPPLDLFIGPGVDVYIFGAAGDTNYHAVECSVATG